MVTGNVEETQLLGKLPLKGTIITDLLVNGIGVGIIFQLLIFGTDKFNEFSLNKEALQDSNSFITGGNTLEGRLVMVLDGMNHRLGARCGGWR